MPVGWCQGSYWRLISTRSLTWCQVSPNPHQIFCAKAMLIILLDFSLIIRYDCAANRAGKSARTMRTQESKFRIVATVTVVTTPQNPLLCHLRTLSAALWLIQWFLPTSCFNCQCAFQNRKQWLTDSCCTKKNFISKYQFYAPNEGSWARSLKDIRDTIAL